MKIKSFFRLMSLMLCITSSAYAIVFIYNITQVWAVEVHNKSKIPLYVLDEVFYADDKYNKFQKVVVNPGSFYRSKWNTAALGKSYNRVKTRDDIWVLSSQPALGRKITIWGDCGGTVESTNKIIIGNTNDATRVEVPSGTYSIINSPNASTKAIARCNLCIAVPFDNSRCQ